MRTSVCMTIGAVAAWAGLAVGPEADSVGAASSAMPVAQQNALVQKYCAVCHTDAHKNGGLSLEHFDAANADPGVAAIMASKVKSGALGAAGVPPPDKATTTAWLIALSEEAVGADRWTVGRTKDPATRASLLTASVVREVPSAAHAGEPDMYRLTLTCDVATREGEMQLAWAPAPPPAGRALAVAVDGKRLFTYKVEGTEKMGNGASGSSGPGSTVFYATGKNSVVPAVVMSLPEQTLTFSDLFPDETVEFSFGGLTQADRRELATCFAGSRTRQ